MLLQRLGILSLGALALTSQAQGDEDAALQAFLQARGEPAWIGAAAEHPAANEVTRPLPGRDTLPADPAKSNLGFALFHDPRLSRDGTVTCASCHMGMLGGTDRQRVSRGIGGALGDRNAPTVFNSAFNFRQFWDGRAFNLDEQALGPISNPVEMGHDLDAVLDQLAGDPNYSRQFAAVYPDGVTAANLGNAIAEHSRDMTRTDSRFNQYLTTGTESLSALEKTGWQRFNDLGCTSCHNGINLGGNSYQRSGNVAAFAGTGLLAAADPGLFNRTGRETDRQVFKVPSLHNVALTAPYFHDGSVDSLSEAVRQQGRLNAGRELSEADVTAIVAFLNTLSSEAFAGMSSHGGGMHEQMHQSGMHSQHMNHQQHHSQTMHQEGF